MKNFRVLCVVGVVLFAGAAADSALAAKTFSRQEDVIYGRKYGTALTMDVFTPTANANGAAIVMCISGGWISDHARIQPALVMEPLSRGYTVFAVVHGSQPKFTIPECVADMNRAIRYIRTHAKDFGIDPNRIGVPEPPPAGICL